MHLIILFYYVLIYLPPQKYMFYKTRQLSNYVYLVNQKLNFLLSDYLLKPKSIFKALANRFVRNCSYVYT